MGARTGRATRGEICYSVVNGDGVKHAIATVRTLCGICGRDELDDRHVIARGRDHEYRNTTDDAFTFVRCPCGHVYLNPRPAPSELGTIYPHNYYAYQLLEQRRRQPTGGDRLLARMFRKGNLRRYAAYADRIRGELRRERYRVLDIGCGDGAVLDMWREAFGGAIEGHGIEMNDDAAAIARSDGWQVVSSRIEDAGLDQERGAFDFIYSFHVIEHVEDPAQFLVKAREALRSDGYLLIDTPNIDSVDFRFFRREHWGGYHFPRHWNLYSAQTFGRLAHNAGLEIVSVEYYPVVVFWVWTCHSLLSKVSPRLADRLFPPAEIFYRGTLWNLALWFVFSWVEWLQLVVTGKCSAMRVLLRPLQPAMPAAGDSQ